MPSRGINRGACLLKRLSHSHRDLDRTLSLYSGTIVQAKAHEVQVKSAAMRLPRPAAGHGGPCHLVDTGLLDGSTAKREAAGIMPCVVDEIANQRLAQR